LPGTSGRLLLSLSCLARTEGELMTGRTALLTVVAFLGGGSLTFPASELAGQKEVSLVPPSERVEVSIGGRTLVVPAHDDSVTIVLFVEPEWDRPVTLTARYRGAHAYRATDATGVPPGEVRFKTIPWHPWPLTIGRSRQIDLERGDIVMITFPRDYDIAGWLRQES
jgi:hypothetical protein